MVLFCKTHVLGLDMFSIESIALSSFIMVVHINIAYGYMPVNNHYRSLTIHRPFSKCCTRLGFS